jgi:hypothetical protein
LAAKTQVCGYDAKIARCPPRLRFTHIVPRRGNLSAGTEKKLVVAVIVVVIALVGGVVTAVLLNISRPLAKL